MRALELKIPPVGVFLLAGVAMWALARLLPAAELRLPAQPFVAAAFFIAAGIVGLAGIAAFRRQQTSVDPTRPDKATSLVVAGIYQWSRNPMYLGLLLLLTAWAVFLESALALLVLPAFIVYMNRFQIAPEERALLDKFGQSYTQYVEKVRRWL